MYYTPTVLILGIDLKAAKYIAIKASLAEQEITIPVKFLKLDGLTKLLGVLKIV